MQDNRFVQFLVLGFSIVAFLLALKFVAGLLPGSNPVFSALKGAIEAV